MYYLDLLGTLAFAISGAFKAKGRELNIFGVVFLGIITAIGGGTIRDLIIGRTPLFYLLDKNYLIIAILGGVLAYFVPTFFKRRYSFFRFLDSIGVATFAIMGTSIAFQHLYKDISIISSISSISLGVFTASGGGILRDAIMGDVPYALKHGSNYIKSAFWGSLIFFALMTINQIIAAIVSIGIVILLREFFSPYGIYYKVILNSKHMH